MKGFGAAWNVVCGIPAPVARAVDLWRNARAHGDAQAGVIAWPDEMERPQPIIQLHWASFSSFGQRHDAS